MDKLKWCPNCNQLVAPQKKMGNRGGIFLGLLLLGILLGIFVGWILGLIVIAAAAAYLVVGLVSEISTLAAKGECPICKAHNLLDRKPD